MKWRKSAMRPPDDAIAAAIRREQWELLAHWLLLGALSALRASPAGTVDDLLALLEGEDGDERK